MTFTPSRVSLSLGESILGEPIAGPQAPSGLATYVVDMFTGHYKEGSPEGANQTPYYYFATSRRGNTASLSETIDDFSRIVRPLTGEERVILSRGLVSLDAAWRCEKDLGRTGISLNEIASHNLDSFEEKGLLDITVFLYAVHRYRNSHNVEDIHELSGEINSLTSFIRSLSKKLHVNALSITRSLGRRKEALDFSSTVPFFYFRYLLALLRILHHPKPWAVISRVESTVIATVFRPLVGQPMDKVPQEISDLGISPSRVQALRRIGLSGLAQVARAKRAWSVEKLKEEIDKLRGGGEGIADERLARILSDQEDADFTTLCQLVQALNQGIKPVISLKEAFVANYPYLPYVSGEDFTKAERLASTLAEHREHILTVDGKVKTMKVVGTEKNLDPKGFPALFLGACRERNWTVKEASRRLQLSDQALKPCLQDPEGEDIDMPGKAIVEACIQPENFGFKRKSVFKAIYHSFWSRDPDAAIIHSRSAWGPLFFDPHMRRRMKEYAKNSRTSQGELLFTLRYSANPSQRQNHLFLPTLSEFAREIGMPLAEYERCEKNERPLTLDEIEKIVECLGLEGKDRICLIHNTALLRNSCIRALEDEVRHRWPQWQEYDGIVRFLALLSMQWLPHQIDFNKVRKWLDWLQKHDPESFQFLERVSQDLTGTHKDDTKRVFVALWKGYHLLRAWPKRLEKKGPALSYYYHHFKEAETVFEKLKKAIRNPHHKRLDFEEDGSFTATKIS